MLVKAWRFAALLLAALAMAMEVGSLASMPTRLTWDGLSWLAAHNPGGPLRPFGPVGQVIECAALVAVLVLAFLVRNHRRPVMRLTVIAAAQIVLAVLVWWLFVYSVEAEIPGWSPADLPRNWSGWRNQWEFAHALRAVVLLVAFATLLLSVVIDTMDEPRPPDPTLEP